MATELVDSTIIAREATTRSLSDIARYLQETLGQQIVAYVCGLKDPKMVGSWASEKAQPRPPADLRLRQAYQAVRLIADVYGPGTARAWLFGSNPRLDDEAPAYLLRYARTFDEMRLIVTAARAFVAGGF
ncbi:MAG: XRE family transcriptional regulator [Chloroflexi bacterium]|nr:XRE family transcriptional regulator [Chloroflexota bacterium]